MEDVVTNNEAEVQQSDLEPSTSSETESAPQSVDSEESSDEASGHADEGETNDDADSTQNAEGRSEKADNRYRELANENKQLKEEINAFKQSSDYTQGTIDEMDQRLNSIDPAQLNAQELGHFLQAERQRNLLAEERREIDSQWERAVAKHPELEKDVDFSNLVYQNYLAERQMGSSKSVSDVADQFKKYIESRAGAQSKEAYKKAEQNLTQKATAGSSSNIAASGSKDPEKAAESRRKQDFARAIEENDTSVLEDYFKY